MPLTHAFGFTIAKASDSRPFAPIEVPESTMTAEQVASGRRWSAKVVLFSGVAASALHATDNNEFQVRVRQLSVQHPLSTHRFQISCPAANSRSSHMRMKMQLDPCDDPNFRPQSNLAPVICDLIPKLTSAFLLRSTRWRSCGSCLASKGPKPAL